MHRATADPRASWPAEVALLLACVRTHVKAEEQARLAEAVDGRLDWQRVLMLARRHRIIPLLHLQASRGQLPMPDDVMAALGQQAQTNTRRMLQLSAELTALLEHCARAGVATVPLKGPVLAEQLYRSVALRSAGDLDVLVRHTDVAAVVELLRARHYEVQEHASPELAEMARRDLHHVIAIEPKRRIRIELHYWLLRPRGRQTHDLDALAPHLRPFSFMGQPTRVFEDQALLAYLCEHGAEHSWSRLEWLATVAALFHRGTTGGGSFAATLGATRRIAAAQQLAGALFGEDHAVADAWSTQIANAIVVRRLQREPERVDESSSERFRYLLLTDASVAAIARRCRTMLLAPGIGDAEALPLPRPLAPLRWAIRPLRLLVRRVRDHDGRVSAGVHRANRPRAGRRSGRRAPRGDLVSRNSGS